MAYEDQIAREAAQVAADYLEHHGRDHAAVVVAVETSQGGGAIVGLRELGEDDIALLAQLVKITTVFAGSLGKTITLVDG